MTTTALNIKISEVGNKISDTNSLVTTAVLNTKISEVESKALGNSKYITTQKFNKLTAKNFVARLKQIDLVNKTDFNNKLTSFNKRVTTNKIKHSKIQKKLNSLITKDYKFSLGKIYFTSNDGSQNTFIYQPTLDALDLKKTKVLIMFLVGNQRSYIILNTSHYILLSCLA